MADGRVVVPLGPLSRPRPAESPNQIRDTPDFDVVAVAEGASASGTLRYEVRPKESVHTRTPHPSKKGYQRETATHVVPIASVRRVQLHTLYEVRPSAMSKTSVGPTTTTGFPANYMTATFR